MSAGHWTRLLRRKPPTDLAAQAASLVLLPVAFARLLWVAAKAFPSVRVATLTSLGVATLPPDVQAASGVIDGRKSQDAALRHLEAAGRHTQRDDHNAEFMR
mmetsp:Transcript_102358/g.286956  ORF Transcript_102358/g.286956 Transcript_102358/m.286956 type:complete len:102 (-) Transcript_102358:9-314(-)